MSVKQYTNAKKNDAPLYGRSASFMACENCEEGALVWDSVLEESKCNCCGTVQTPPSRR